MSKAKGSLRLDHQLCFPLHAAARAMDGLYRTALADLGLTYPQYLVMMVLWEEGPERPVPVKELGRRLRLDSGTLSPLLKRMEAAGQVTRRRSTADERSVEVAPTPEGMGLRGRAEQVPPRVAGAVGLSEAEVHELRATLERMIAAIDEEAARW